MNNKDLFNAIDKAAEEYVDKYAAEGVEDAGCERPVVLRPEKKPRSVRKIVLGAAACAAAVSVIGAGVTVGMKYYSGRAALVSGSSGDVPGSTVDIERNFAPRAEILRIRDVGFYTEGMSSEYRKAVEDWYSRAYTREFFESSFQTDNVPPQPDVYYYNDLPLDRRMLSNEAYSFLSRYCLLSEEDRAGETVPDDVKYLTGHGIIRFGDLGFLEDKYTKQELKRFKAYCANPLVFSSLPPEPDVYYYNDIPYHLEYLDRMWGFDVADAKNWLKWYCWLDEETQAQLGGYVPEEMEGRMTGCNSEKPQEIVTYKGRVFDVRSVSYDTERYIKWYNALSPKLQAKVWYAPEELSEENLARFPLDTFDVKIIGADGVPLTYEDLLSDMTEIYKVTQGAGMERELTELSDNELEQWDEIRCGGFVYLSEPGSDEFRRYNVGDEIMGLKITGAATTFRRFEDVSDPALYYAGGEVRFEGTATVDVLAFDNDSGMKCAISGLPIIDIDEGARAEGKIVPQQHSADEFADDPAALLNDDSHCYSGGINGFGGKQLGQIQRGVEIEEINIDWRYDFDNTKWYQVHASLPIAPNEENLSTRFETFSTAKEQVKFADVKDIAEPDFVGYELEYIMPSEKVYSLNYVYTDGKVSVRDSSGFEIATQFYEKIKRDNMVFWKGLLTDSPIVVYISESNAYIANFESDMDLSRSIDKIISLL